METQSREDVKSMMETLVNHAKSIREGYKYSGDEKMMPMAFIYGEKITIMILGWTNEKEKYQMAAAANLEARKAHAKSLSFVSDVRWVKSETFCEYFKFDKALVKNFDAYRREYQRILAAHEGQVKKMAPYREGPNDTIEWLPVPYEEYNSRAKSDMLTDWWR
jgi:hypothetical protein